MGKKIFAVALTVLSLLILSGCARVSLPESNNSVLIFDDGEKSISAVLIEEEVIIIRHIFEGKTLFADQPSCGFTEKISIRFGLQQYFIALDGCTIVKDHESGKFFSLIEEEMKTIHGLFKKYGGYFPCV